MLHILKTYPEHFQALYTGHKTFELIFTKNINKFNIGDSIVFQEFNSEQYKYTGREIKKEITYIEKCWNFIVCLGLK